ncbi:low specificity L-threonine aldolase [Pseudooceanicola sp. 216_PA32_1]|uniref:Low specificity L-threonine aldolase n=2 Tax=Pseudooceanicola pacificus TaxID=2676438 RepID=A0A844WCR8_9RHOB|nr:low specificity L-threonine aldolase [Pseudooceanicola pacificus]
MSDNCAGAAPEVLTAMIAAQKGRDRSYGHDAVTARAVEVIRQLFEAPEAEVFFVATGTAANALALATICPPWGSVYAARSAHLDVDECGAPGFFTGGATLRLLDHADGLVDPGTLDRALTGGRAGDVHAVQPAALSIAQISELGAAYSPAEVAALSAVAHWAGLRVHMDGARFANAVAYLGCTPADASWRAGVDVLSLGATKNGGLGAEAVIFFDPQLARDFGYRRKRGGHLLSKTRVVSAQIEAMFGDGLWLRLAARANATATRLAEGLAALPEVAVLNRVDGNMVFARFGRTVDAAMRAAGVRYSARPDGDGMVRARLVTAFDTTVEDVDAALRAARAGGA